MMRNLRELDEYRVTTPEVIARFGSVGDGSCGAFRFDHLRVLAASGQGWDHISVSCEDRCPTWAEMDWIKRMFFHPSETAMQLHVPEDKHIDCHPYCLHLWRPKRTKIPLPPPWMVGPKPQGE